MNNTAEKTTDKRIVEFVPFGTEDKIKLSLEMVKRLIAVKTSTGKTCSDEDAFKFMLMCQARRLNPFEGDAFLIGYDGRTGPTFSLITAHQAFLKRAELHPEFDGMDSGVIVLREGQILDLIGDFHMPTDNILGGWATVFFKHRQHAMKKRLRVTRFNKGFGVWKDDPAGMIVKCAEADALRSSFPTMLGGMYTMEETPVKTEIATPVFESEKPPVVSAEPVVEAPVPQPQPAPPPSEPPPPKKKAPSDSPPTSSESTSKRKLKAKAPSIKRQPKHEQLQAKLAFGNFGPSDLIGIALENGWIEMSEATWETLSEEKCAESLDPENWQVIMTLLEERQQPK